MSLIKVLCHHFPHIIGQYCLQILRKSLAIHPIVHHFPLAHREVLEA